MTALDEITFDQQEASLLQVDVLVDEKGRFKGHDAHNAPGVIVQIVQDDLLRSDVAVDLESFNEGAATVHLGINEENEVALIEAPAWVHVERVYPDEVS